MQSHDFSNSTTPRPSRFRDPGIVARDLSSAAHSSVDRPPARKAGDPTSGSHSFRQTKLAKAKLERGTLKNRLDVYVDVIWHYNEAVYCDIDVVVRQMT
jgi:hypothetical protein